MARRAPLIDETIIVDENRSAELSIHQRSSVAREGLHVRDLQLRDFRSYRDLSLTIDARPIILVGPNGAGKTNLLEAISLLAPGRGMRSAELEELSHRAPDQPFLDKAENSGGHLPLADPVPTAPGAAAWTIHAQMSGLQGSFALGIGLDPLADNARRLSRIDGRPATASEIGAQIRVIWATPSMDRLFTGGATDRRKFLDRLALGFAPHHGPIANQYEKAMRDRQRVLEENGDNVWLNALEARMAETGSALAATRVEVLHLLQSALERRGDSLFPQADLDLSGSLERAFLVGQPAAQVEADFLEHLRTNRYRDRAAGRCLDGPHRADLLARHRRIGREAGECSTGEQKALLISILLGFARASKDHFGQAPLILLDEAGAHLDATRRAALCVELQELQAQAWLTGTDPHLFHDFGDQAQAFWVENNRLDAISLLPGAASAFQRSERNRHS